MKWNRSRSSLVLMLVGSTVHAANLTDSWSSAVSGFWTDTAKWSLNAVPNNGSGNTYSVVVSATGSAYTLGLNGGTYTVNDFSLNSVNATFNLSGGMLSVVNSAFNLAAGTFQFDNGTISGGSITQNGGLLKFGSGGVFANNASVIGSINLSTASSATTFSSGADFTGSATLSGSSAALFYNYNATIGAGRTINLADANSELYIARNFNTSTDDSLTLANGATLRGKGYVGSYGGTSNALINNGLISADLSGNYLYVQPQLFTNNGTLQALNGATLVVNGGSWSNNGTFVLDSTSTITLGGTFTLGSTGFNNVVRPAGSGGTINISGFVNNTGNTINLPAAAGNIRMYGGTINGGTVNQSGGTLLFTSNGGTLSGNAVLVGNLNITDPSGSASLFSGGNFTGNATLSGSSASLFYGYNATLGAGQTINLADANSEVYVSRNFNTSTDNSLTLASGATIRGKGYIGSYGGSTNSLVNNGLISADLAGNYLYVQPQIFTNNGTLQALNGATLLINGANWSNNGTLALDATSTLTLGGTLSLGSTGFNKVVRSGGTLNLAGYVNNTGNTINLPAAAGTVRMYGGTINGGTISESGGTLSFSSNGGTLSGNAVLVGNLNITDPSGSASLFSGGNFTGNATLSGTSASLFYGYNATLGAGQTINLADANSEVYISRNFNTSTDNSLTLASGATIRGKGYIGSYGGSTNSLVNSGLISSDLAGNYLYVQPQIFTNNGTLQALNGATLLINGANWSNNGTFVLDSSSTLTLGGTLSLGSTGFNDVVRPGPSSGALNLSGFVNNTGNTINIPAAAGTVRMYGGTINGGTINESGGSLSFSSNGGTLSGNAVLGGNLIVSDNSGNASLFSGGNFTGNATLSGSSSSLFYGYNATLGAGQTINLADANSEVYVSRNFNTSTDNSLTVASGATIRGKGYVGSYGGSTNSLVNNGLISADLANNYLYVQPQVFTNNGTLQALNGATLLINSANWSNNGTLALDATSTLTLGGTLSLGSTGFNDVVRPGPSSGALNLSGYVNNTGNTINLPAAAGNIRMYGGNISGGTINQNGGTLEFTSNGGTLSGNAVLVGNLNITDTSGSASLFSGGNFTGNATLSGSSASLFYGYNATLGAGQTINLADANSEVYISRNFNTSTDNSLTLASSATIRGKGYVGSYGGSTNSLVNNGLISSDLAGNYLYVQPQIFTNNGTLQALNGATLTIHSSTNYTNSSGILKVASAGKLIASTITGNLNNSLADGTSSLMRLSGTYTINQTLAVTNHATVNLMGSYTRSGNIDDSGQIIFDYTGASPLASIQSAIASGYNNGSWNGTGIYSSAAASNHAYGVGFGEAATVLGSGGGTFFGESVDGTAILTRLTLFGDANLDGVVNIADLGLLATHYGQSGQTWTGGDFNYDGTINIADLGVLATHYGAGASVPLALSFEQALQLVEQQSGQSLPEPSLALLGLGLLLRRRK